MAEGVLRGTNADLFFVVMTSAIAFPLGAPLFVKAALPIEARADLPRNLRDMAMAMLMAS
jgi:hypothetical protein